MIREGGTQIPYGDSRVEKVRTSEILGMTISQVDLTWNEKHISSVKNTSLESYSLVTVK